MTEYAPKAIQDMFNRIKQGIPDAIMSGIIGDSAHTYGYHRCRDVLPGDDYSVQYPEDKQGDGQAASALDISWGSAASQHRATQNLMNAKNDSRMNVIRSAFGSVDSVNVVGYDYKGNYPCTSDDSHLWHVHISVLRQFANDGAALAKVADVVVGTGSSGGGTPPPSGGGAKLRRPWPSYMPTSEYFGLITGPNESHGGYYANEQPDIKAIQQRVIALGYVPGIHDQNSSWADGIYEQPTKDAVAAWQRAKYAAYTTRYGEVWNDDWGRLFTY